MKKDRNKKRSKINDIIAEIAHDLNIDRKLVKEVLFITFKEIAMILILKRSPVMIRGFIKVVIAAKGIKRIKENLENMKTKMK